MQVEFHSSARRYLIFPALFVEDAFDKTVAMLMWVEELSQGP